MRTDDRKSPVRKIVRNAFVIAALTASSAFARDWDARWADVLIESNALILEASPTIAQREQVRELVRSEFERDPVTTLQQLMQLEQGLQQMRELPAGTRALALGATRLEFLLKSERDAAAGDALSRVVLESYRAAHPPIDPRAPIFSAQVADAFIDAFLFHGEVSSGRPAPRLSAAEREQLRREVAGDFVRANEETRQRMIESMARITSYRIQWPELDDLQRLSVRAELGAPLSLEEQQLLQQYRHLVSGHQTKMLANELNFMRDMQQTIMGSAPYWNPASQSWEQKGGIVTEFR
ncbi:MAG: hypothetical protein MUE46_09720 [Xanthomonadales bacterium]|jgi:hypothetical protein|nr:hypothetical protein [Xanthomonadales bacterium]